MGFIKNLKIRDKLLLLLAIVLIPLLYFIGVGIYSEVKERQELKEAYLQFEESEKISQLIHEFQKERALGMGYVYSKVPQFKNAFQLQVLKTDIARNKLEDFLQENNRRLPYLQSFTNLDSYRNQIEELTLDVSFYDNFSTTALEKLSNRIQDNATGISDLEVRQRLSSYVNLLNSKVYLGKLRVSLIGLISTDTVSYQEYSDIFINHNFYKKSSQGFMGTAPDYIATAYKERLSNKNFQKVLQMVSDVKQDSHLNFKAYNPLLTYNTFSRSVEDIKGFENILIRDLKNSIEDKIVVKEKRLLLYFLIIFFILSLVIVLSIYIINTVSRSLLSLKNAADKVSKGYTDVVIQVDSSDEIGALAESFRKLVTKNIDLTCVADAIGKGNYDVNLAVESDQDVLANAIRKMKESLGKFSMESERRNWLLSGISEVNNLISGAVDVGETCNKVIEFLVNYTGAKLGAVYVADDHASLLPSASYAVETGETELPVLTIGKGQVGQAVLQSKTVILENVEKKFFKVKTAFSETGSMNIAIVPLVFEKNIAGVIEIASIEAFTPLHIEFLEDAAEKIAVVIHTLKIYHKTQELLYETQNQAEEMETQQEELRQVNSELRASDEELRASQEELEEKNSELQEKARQLADQYHAASNKNREIEEARQAIEMKVREVETISKYKSEFLANMSHELRTPLNSILLLSKLLGDNPEKTLSQKQVEHLNIIYNSGSDLLKLINEVLDLSKIESGRVSVDAQDIKLKSLNVQKAFLQEAEQKNIQFNVQFSPGLPETIYTDKFRLEQVLKNLLSNAFKFTPTNGRIDFTVFVPDKSNVFKSSALNTDTDKVAFSVKDTGIGIPKSKQHLVFEAFQQADASTTRKFGGTGLGLAISRELANILGGEIRIESEENKGSTFTLYLPVKYQRADKGNQKKILPSTEKFERVIEKVGDKIEVENSGKGTASILIVEDDRGFSNILADFAATKKFKVWQAFNGADGIQLAKEYVPDAILLDIQLPDINGWKVLEEIKKEDTLRNSQIHVMSAYDQDIVGNNNGHDEFLPKPLTLEMLDKAFVNISNTIDTPLKRILVVEDNQVENYAITELLLAHQIQSISAFTGNEAYDLLHKRSVDCVILDLNLPDMGGYELMEKLKKSDKFSDLPIIIYSGKDLSEEEERKLKKYANTIIIKNQFSYIRLLDEVQLFLHTVNEKLPGKEKFKMNLHVPEQLLKDKKVLIVDDDVRNIYSLYSVLEGRSMRVSVANDGKEALERLEEEKDIDIVLMDIMMPEMDGIEATKIIRKNPSWRNLPVIALTAKAMKGDREKCLEAGASDYISKPIEIDRLLTLMRVWLYDK